MTIEGAGRWAWPLGMQLSLSPSSTLCSTCAGIKAIKLYAWEAAYEGRIGALRDQELVQIRRSALLGTLSSMVWSGGPILIRSVRCGGLGLG